jgi:hypothetical protein
VVLGIYVYHRWTTALCLFAIVEFTQIACNHSLYPLASVIPNSAEFRVGNVWTYVRSEGCDDDGSWIFVDISLQCANCGYAESVGEHVSKLVTIWSPASLTRAATSVPPTTWLARKSSNGLRNE